MNIDTTAWTDSPPCADPNEHSASMSPQGHPPSMVFPSNHHHPNGRPIPTAHFSVEFVPLQKPSTVYIGQQVYTHSLEHPPTCGHPKTRNGSISSASTDSAHQTTTHSRADPMHIYSPSFPLSSQAEQGTLGVLGSARAYPNQYTRPSRSEMAEINAAYQKSHKEDDLSEDLEDHAMWIVVGCYSDCTSQGLPETGLVVFARPIILRSSGLLYDHHTFPTTPACAIAPVPVSLRLVRLHCPLHFTNYEAASQNVVCSVGRRLSCS